MAVANTVANPFTLEELAILRGYIENKLANKPVVSYKQLGVALKKSSGVYRSIPTIGNIIHKLKKEMVKEKILSSSNNDGTSLDKLQPFLIALQCNPAFTRKLRDLIVEFIPK